MKRLGVPGTLLGALPALGLTHTPFELGPATC